MKADFTLRLSALETEWRHAAGRMAEAERAHRQAKERVRQMISAPGYRIGKARAEVKASLQALENYQAAVRTEADAFIRLQEERDRVLRMTAAHRREEFAQDPVFQARMA